MPLNGWADRKVIGLFVKFCKDTLDFVLFSYYNFSAESVDPNAEPTPGNTILGVKNPYRASSESACFLSGIL